MPQSVSAGLAALLIVLSIMVGVLMAQRSSREQPLTLTEEAVPTEEAVAQEPCSTMGLIAAKEEIDALLATFERDAAADTNRAITALYDAGESYRQLALDCGYMPENFNTLVINSQDVNAVTVAIEDLTTDSLRGQLLYNGEEPSASGDVLGCAGCHNGGPVAPPTEGYWTRWDEERSQEERFVDYTFEQYTVESIILPWEYFVPTYPEYTMPDFYHEQLSYQDLADIVAYLGTQDQLVE
jgi:mono/diheme cytochrome c family protein